MDRRQFASSVAALTTASALPISSARAAVTFERKTISLICPFGVGGGGDLWARFIAPFLSKYLPGQPNVVVENRPGGGSISGTNAFAATANHDAHMRRS